MSRRRSVGIAGLALLTPLVSLPATGSAGATGADPLVIEAQLNAESPDFGDHFGSQVALSGRRLAVLAQGGLSSDPSVRVYERDGVSWSLQRTILPGGWV